jgi:hypothetical protein
MKKLTKQDKTDFKIQAAVWQHGSKKANLTIAIGKIIRTGLAEHPDVKKAIKVLEDERKRLEEMQLF